MRLHEEYAIRKGLKIPIILYERESCIILKTKDPPYRWKVFSINWRNGRYAPGLFEANISEPYDSLSHEFFCSMDFEIQWEEYADFVMNFVTENQREWIAVEEKETNLAVWAMFLQVYDGWLSRNTTREFHQLVVESIREDNDYHQRLRAFKKAKLALENNDDIRRLFKYQIFPIAKKHSDWLEKLINDR